MVSDPRAEVAVEIVPEPIPRALFDSLFTAFADVAIDYGLTIGGRILGEAGTTRSAGGTAEMRALRVQVADRDAEINRLNAEIMGYETGYRHGLNAAEQAIARERARTDAAERRAAELEAENFAVDEGHPEELDRLLAALAESLPEESVEEQLAAADRAYRRARRVAVQATGRVDVLYATAKAAVARADAAEARVAEVSEIVTALATTRDGLKLQLTRAETARRQLRRRVRALTRRRAEQERRTNWLAEQCSYLESDAALVTAQARIAELESAAADTAPTTVTDAMVEAAIEGAEEAGGFAREDDQAERRRLFRAALTAALAVSPAGIPLTAAIARADTAERTVREVGRSLGRWADYAGRLYQIGASVGAPVDTVERPSAEGVGAAARPGLR